MAAFLAAPSTARKRGALTGERGGGIGRGFPHVIRPGGGTDGQVVEWLKAADCKSARASVRWFESSPVHQPFLATY